MYTNHIVWSLSTTGLWPIILFGISVLLDVYTNHIVCLCIPIILFVCVYQSYCLVSQYYWLCIPIILFGLSILLDVYTNHIVCLCKPIVLFVCVYQSYCLFVYTNHVVCLCIPIILFGLSILLVVYTNHIVCLFIPIILFVCVNQSYCLFVYTNHIVWSLITPGCVYQSYCLVSQYYSGCVYQSYCLFVYTIILFGLSVLPNTMIGIHKQTIWLVYTNKQYDWYTNPVVLRYQTIWLVTIQ